MPAVRYPEIRRRRKALGLKLGPFAIKAGVSYKTLANIECGQIPSDENVALIAAALGCPAADILLPAQDEEEEDQAA